MYHLPVSLLFLLGLANACTDRSISNKNCNPGSGSDNDRLWVIGSYYDLSNPEYGWGERAQSFSCTSCPTCGN